MCGKKRKQNVCHQTCRIDLLLLNPVLLKNAFFPRIS